MTAVAVWDNQPTADELLARRLQEGWQPTPTRLQEGPRILGHAACLCPPVAGQKPPENSDASLPSSRLHPEEAAGLAAELPLLVRGTFYEGWHPAGKPVKTRSADEFLAPVADAFRGDSPGRPTEVARAVFTVLKRHVSAGEVADVIAALPGDVQTLWA